MKPRISAKTMVAAVVGAPVAHSLSPLVHNAWLEAAGLDATYLALSPGAGGFASLVEAMRGGVMRGFNVTVPFKLEALALADRASARAERMGAANLVIFHGDGAISADNTDGAGLVAALASQAPDYQPADGPAIIFGAGGAARSAIDALIEAGVPRIYLFNRTLARAGDLARRWPGQVRPVSEDDLARAMGEAAAVINATTLGLGGGDGPGVPLEAAPPSAVVMDMVYRPLRTRFLTRAAELGLRTVDGLEMLIGQAAPSFETLFGRPPPPLDIRALALTALDGGQ